MAEKKRGQISWFTPPGLGDKTGYGYAAVETIRAIQAKNVAVPFETNDMDYFARSNAKCHISFIQPYNYQGQKEQYRIGYTPWESSELPDVWLPIMKSRDEIWTTSEWVADIYRKNDVNNIIRIVPHGINPEIWKINYQYQTDKFTFLHVGGPTERKGGQKVVDAFLDLFDGNKNVSLILKSNGPSEARATVSGAFGNASHHPQISVIEEALDVEGLAQLYSEANCLVYPTRGEGFGLIPFQGIATGLPTIVTNETACAEFAALGFPLRADPTPGDGIHLGEWYDPDEVHLRELMTYVYENFEQAKEHAMHGARIIHNSQTWDHVADIILNILGDKIYEKI